VEILADLLILLSQKVAVLWGFARVCDLLGCRFVDSEAGPHGQLDVGE
jgi:hypothetical protein